MTLPIAFCITELEPGGAERNLMELATRLDPERFAAQVYCLAGPPDNPVLIERLQAHGIPIHYLDASRSLSAPIALVKLTRLLRQQRPQIVQSFLFHANILGTLAARFSRVPHVLTGIRVAEHGRRSHIALARSTSRLVDRHVCVSSAVADFMRNAGLPCEKLVVIPNGVDLVRFESATACLPESLGLPAGRQLLLFVGRLDEQKGANRLLEILPGVFADHAECDLALVGDGPARPALERRAAQLGLAGRVHFLGWRAEIPEILKASQLLVLPSKWEGMPNVVLEAMAAGRAVVAFDVEGVAELLGPTGGPQIAERNSSAAFAAHLRSLLEKPALRNELGIQNQRRVKQHFTLEQMVSRYEQLYDSLLGH